MKSLTWQEMQSFLAVARKHSEQDFLMFQTMFNHGLRVSEATNLSAKNIETNQLTVQRLKGSKRTSQPLLENEREGIGTLARKQVGRLFPVHRSTVWRRMQKYGKEAGIPASKLHPHALKHSTGRLGYEAGIGLPEIQRYLGHVNVRNTLIYLESSDEKASEAFGKVLIEQK